MLKNQPIKIIQVVPQLPPSINGLGDYALNLAYQLRQDYEIETHFVVGDRNWQGATTVENFSREKVEDCSAEALFHLLSTYSDRSASDSTISVLLHYVGYGYAKRGCPVWLVEGLERWRRHIANSQLVTMFHEIYASGKLPWTSSFWLSNQQKHLAARLAQLSDRCFTNNEYYADLLYNLSQAKQTEIPLLPVFSNIGEPQQVLPLADRPRRLIVFGSPANRTRVYQKSLAELSRTCQVLAIEEIWDIGSTTGLSLSAVERVPVVKMGKLPAEEISHILANSLVGFFDYPDRFLAKSGVFAAYCAHKLLPVSSHHRMQRDGIAAGKHYWVPDRATIGLKELVEMQAIADCAYTWYQSHNLLIHAKKFAKYAFA
jgi:hypothetical protein